MRCGLRIADALKLPFACVVSDSDGTPYLRYSNHKMKREYPVGRCSRQSLRRAFDCASEIGESVSKILTANERAERFELRILDP
jgi:hypothetical protein